MSSVAPPPAPLPVSGQAAAGPVALTVSGGQMAALPAGAMLEAVAQARAAKGVMTIATPQGAVQLKALPGQTLPPIPEGARLLLQVTDQGVTLLAVNGRPALGAFPWFAVPSVLFLLSALLRRRGARLA